MNDPLMPPKSLLRPVGRAIHEYRMIRAGDRVLLGLSGGKDSLSLLHILRHLQRCAPVRFEFAAMTVDPQIEGFDPAPLQPYLAQMGVTYFYESQAIMQRAMQTAGHDAVNAYCSRMRRGVMYATARREGYNVLALAQHLDDLAESFLLSAFYGGQLRTMKACYDNDTGDVRIIRPLVYARERQTAAFARAAQLPIVPDGGPEWFRAPSQRVRMKQLLAVEEAQNRHLFKSLLRTLRPLMSADFYQASAQATEAVEA